jgi:sortase A
VIRKAIALTGELLLIGAAFTLLFVGYQVWFSNVMADESARSISQTVERQFDNSGPQAVSERVKVMVAGSEKDVLGLLYIPALKSDVWALPILADVSHVALASGAGHYPSTDLPGEPGNFAIAAHRATNGEPFALFEKLNNGDLVFVKTAEGYFTYELFEDKKIAESQVWVLDDTPKDVVSDSDSLITLTTCDPRWNSTQRWARWGKLIEFSAEAPKELAK